MRMNLLRVGLVSIIAAGLTSCGGEPAEPLTATSAAGVMTQLSSVINGFPRGNTAAAVQLPGNGGISLAAHKPGASTLAAASDCETVNPATPVDADLDGIALLKTGTFNCKDTVGSGGYTYTRIGDYKVQDLDDTKDGVLGGLRVDYNLTDFSWETPTGDTFKGSHLGYWSYKATSVGGMNSLSDYTGRYYYKGSTTNYEIDFSFTTTWDFTLIPDDATNETTVWNSGKQVFKGTYAMSGKFMDEGRGGVHKSVNGSWKVTYYSKDLVYDNVTCTNWYYKSGSIFVDDSNGNLMEIRYLCTGAEFYVNGAKSDWYTPEAGDGQ